MDDTSNTPRLLMLLNSRLTESKTTDTLEERTYRGFGIKLRYRRSRTGSDAPPPAVAEMDAAEDIPRNGTAVMNGTGGPNHLNGVHVNGLNVNGVNGHREVPASEPAPEQPPEIPEAQVSPEPDSPPASSYEPPPGQMGVVPPAVLEEQQFSGQYPILSGKTLAVVGFSPAESADFGRTLAAQYCSFLFLTHADAEFRKGSTNGCDLVLLSVPPEWASPGSLHPASSLSTPKPLAIFGDRDVLAKVAMRRQGGLCELIPAPWTVDEAIWRASTLLSRVQVTKKKTGRKNQQKRVVIGDESAARALLHAVLAQEGMECSVADNGVDALALARNKSADAVVIDVALPGLDGFQVLAEIRRDPRLKDTVVILLTARQAEADVLRGFGLGADDYVPKPFSPMELAARLKRFLGKRT